MGGAAHRRWCGSSRLTAQSTTDTSPLPGPVRPRVSADPGTRLEPFSRPGNRCTTVEQVSNIQPVSKTIGFRPTEDDERIIREAMRDDERTADVIRRALRLLDREAWLARARADAERLTNEDLSGEADAW
jgi:hypothetical protein